MSDLFDDAVMQRVGHDTDPTSWVKEFHKAMAEGLDPKELEPMTRWFNMALWTGHHVSVCNHAWQVICDRAGELHVIADEDEDADPHEFVPAIIATLRALCDELETSLGGGDDA